MLCSRGDDLITTSDTGYGMNDALKGYNTTLAVVRRNLTFQILLNKAPALIGFGCPVRKRATLQTNAAIRGNLSRVVVAGVILDVQLYHLQTRVQLSKTLHHCQYWTFWVEPEESNASKPEDGCDVGAFL